ncbi:MAG: class I SAM-dependent methyltransferase [Pirellulales bacterium]
MALHDGAEQAAQQHNRRAWDALVRKQDRFTRPAQDEQFRDPLRTVDPFGWLGGDIRGKRLLALAAGGGRQGPLYAAAGAEVTVVDISAEMLRLDREVAQQRGLVVRTIQASMDAMPMLAAGEFDIVIHPVSTCYVPDVRPVFAEVARVTAPGGIYVSQHKTPVSLQAEVTPTSRGYQLVVPYYGGQPLPAVQGSRHREPGTLEYLHRWEELLGGMCRVGFIIEDLFEPLHADGEAPRGTFAHRSNFVAPYVRIKARRQGAADLQPRAVVWTNLE